MTYEEQLDLMVERHNYDWLLADSESMASIDMVDNWFTCDWYMNTKNGRGLVWC